MENKKIFVRKVTADVRRTISTGTQFNEFSAVSGSGAGVSGTRIDAVVSGTRIDVVKADSGARVSGTGFDAADSGSGARPQALTSRAVSGMKFSETAVSGTEFGTGIGRARRILVPVILFDNPVDSISGYQSFPVSGSYVDEIRAQSFPSLTIEALDLRTFLSDKFKEVDRHEGGRQKKCFRLLESFQQHHKAILKGLEVLTVYKKQVGSESQRVIKRNERNGLQLGPMWETPVELKQENKDKFTPIMLPAEFEAIFQREVAQNPHMPAMRFLTDIIGVKKDLARIAIEGFVEERSLFTTGNFKNAEEYNISYFLANDKRSRLMDNILTGKGNKLVPPARNNEETKKK